MPFKKKKSKKELELESKIVLLKKEFEDQGFTVRREKLARGTAFRVKSGGCLLIDQKVVFVDRRLPLEQQYGVLREYVDSVRAFA